MYQRKVNCLILFLKLSNEHGPKLSVTCSNLKDNRAFEDLKIFKPYPYPLHFLTLLPNAF